MKLLLIVFIFVTGFTSAQFTSNNAPDIGDNILLYVVDSSAVDFASVVGSGVTWDYSNLSHYKEETRLIDVKTPEDAGHGVTFVNSQKAIQVEGELITFIKNDANKRVSQGVVYNDANNGDLILTLEENQGVYYNYPFNLNDTVIDDIVGTATFTYMGQLVNAPTTGKFYTTVDGVGTLKLGANAQYNNVMRYQFVDTINLTVPVLGELAIIHKQFEYYDHTVSNLPIFTHSYLWFGKVGGLVLREFTFVLSKDIGTSSVKEETLAETKVYPNPANSFVSVELPNGVVNAEVSIVDPIGRTILNTDINSPFTQLDISHLNGGTYFVKISSENVTVTKTLMIQ